jgi:hypothetical protein
MAEVEDDRAPGWDAINAALRPLYGGQESGHWAPTIPRALGGQDPLDGAARAWDADRFLAVLGERLPLLMTDLSRRSILADPDVAERVRRGIADDGSSTGMLALGSLRWEVHKPFLRAPWLEVVLRAAQAESLKVVLPGRLPFGRPLTLVALPWIVHLTPGADTAWTVRGEQAIEVSIPGDAARDLAARLEPREGTYPVDGKPLVVFRVEKGAAAAEGRDS